VLHAYDRRRPFRNIRGHHLDDATSSATDCRLCVGEHAVVRECAPAYSASHTVWNGASHDICGLPTCTWYFTVKSLNFLDMTSAYSPEDTVVIDPHPTGVRNGKSRFILDQNSPNPFNPTTAISFEIPTSAKVRLEVFDVRGALVATLVNDDMPPGRQSVVWDGSNSRGHPVASGHYFYRLTAGKEVITKKMILLK
jgi:hypothetical protein